MPNLITFSDNLGLCSPPKNKTKTKQNKTRHPLETTNFYSRKIKR
jgi:hypothetical protein